MNYTEFTKLLPPYKKADIGNRDVCCVAYILIFLKEYFFFLLVSSYMLTVLVNIIKSMSIYGNASTSSLTLMS